MAEALGIVSSTIRLVSLGYSLVNAVNVRRLDYDYDSIITALGNAMEKIDWLHESGQKAMSAFDAFDTSIRAGIPLQDISTLYREIGPLLSELVVLLVESQKRSPISLPWRLNARRRNIVARLNDLNGKLNELLTVIHSQETQLIEGIRASLPSMTLDKFARAAIKALLDEKLLLPAAQLTSTARLYGAEPDAPSIPKKTLEGDAMARTNEAVFDLLQYEAMSNRTSTIAEAAADSCKWVFDEHGGNSTKLSKWLEHGNGLYLIAGKEGSGKSTLMKYIWSEPRTMELLKNWSPSGTSSPPSGTSSPPIGTLSPPSGTSSPVIAAYFFWRSGTRLQRSEEGLLRSLIYSILKQNPEFMPKVLPKEWTRIFESFLRGSSNPIPGLVAWEAEDLRTAFKSLFSLPIKLFFLVDGLDEYQDDKATRIDMIRSLTEDLGTSPNVKILASSRLLADFAKLEIRPSINLHESNHEAICGYVHNTLESDSRFKAAETLDNVNGPKVIEYLLSTATRNGSFLWATLAVKTIQTQLSNQRTLEEIQRELNTRLPEHLREFYLQLWSNMSTGQQNEASEILQIVLAGRSLKLSSTDSGEALRLVDLALAIGDPKNAVEMPISPWALDRIRTDCRRVANSFTTSWPNFIKVNNMSDMISTRIEFCHRSVLEFLELEETRQILKDQSPSSDFCPYTSHLKSAVQHLKILPKPLHKGPLPLLWVFVTTALVAANKVDSRNSAEFSSYESLLTELDRTMEYHHRNICKDSEYQSRYLESRMQDATGAVEWRDRGRDYKRVARMHWSNFHFDRECSHPRDWEDSFLSLAVQFGLNNYVKRVLQKGGSTQKMKKGRPLLNYAVAPSALAPYAFITPELVESLLSYGAKVGEKFEKKSCWENALRWQYETYVESGAVTANGSNTEERALAEGRAKIFLVLLKRGANTQVSIETSRRIISAKTVVEDSFKSLASERTYQELEQFFP